MDIHAPDKPILSFKEFAVHIAVVTVGILIALGLEGVREVLHDRHLVRETRENFRVELEGDLEHSKLEAARVGKIKKNLDQFADDLPGPGTDHQGEIALRLKAVEHNSGYFLRGQLLASCAFDWCSGAYAD